MISKKKILIGAAIALLLIGVFINQFSKKQVVSTPEKEVFDTESFYDDEDPQLLTPEISREPKSLQINGPKPVTDDERIRGNKNAKVTLVVYSDYECPFCKKFHRVRMPELMKMYGDKIRFVYRDFPLIFHENAPKEAQAARCVFELAGNDVYWSFTDKIYERTHSGGTGFDLADLGPLAQEVGVNKQSFQKCFDSGKYEKIVMAQKAEGKSAGVNSTPQTFIIDSRGKTRKVVGSQPVATFKAIIDQALK